MDLLDLGGGVIRGLDYVIAIAMDKDHFQDSPGSSLGDEPKGRRIGVMYFSKVEKKLPADVVESFLDLVLSNLMLVSSFTLTAGEMTTLRDITVYTAERFYFQAGATFHRTPRHISASREVRRDF